MFLVLICHRFLC